MTHIINIELAKHCNSALFTKYKHDRTNFHEKCQKYAVRYWIKEMTFGIRSIIDNVLQI